MYRGVYALGTLIECSTCGAVCIFIFLCGKVVGEDPPPVVSRGFCVPRILCIVCVVLANPDSQMATVEVMKCWEWTL